MGSSIQIRRGINILRGPVIEFTNDSVGTYLLFLEISVPLKIQIKNAEVELDKGYYIYIGSAFGSGGLSSRIHRHLRKRKLNHWHIDQVTMNQYCKFHGVAAFLNERRECTVSKFLNNMESIVPILGFGSSDCKNNCSSHFFKLE